MNNALMFGVAALVLNLLGYIPYISGTIKGNIKPQRVTWGIWTILNLIGAVNQIANHGGYSILFLGSTSILVITVFALSLRKGVGGASAFDRTVLTSALVLFAVWIFTHNTRTSTIIAVAIDAIAGLPTVIKAYRRPNTEAYLQWIMAGLSGFLSVLSITRVDLILYVYPVYICIGNLAIITAKFLGEARARRKNKNRSHT